MAKGNIARFMPPDMRTRITKDIIDVVGIRPLSKMISVNPKTVYKYKHGTARPTDGTMARILAVVKEKDPNQFREYLDALRTSFVRALEAPVEVGREVPKKPKLGPRVRPKPPRSKPLERKVLPVEPPAQLSKFEMYSKLGLASPPDRMKLAKILAVVEGMESFSAKDLAQKANIPLATVKKYFEMLVDAGYLKKISRGTYQLRVKIQL